MLDRGEVIRDAEEAIEILSNADEPTPWCDFVRIAFGHALELLKAQEPVVRCKDCKHHLECNYWIENGDDWYCANGERR